MPSYCTKCGQAHALCDMELCDKLKRERESAAQSGALRQWQGWQLSQ